MRRCLFCGSDKGLSKEHIIAEWLQNELNLKKENVLIVSGSDESIINSRKHSFNTLTDGRVCEICNNGWMSNLESKTKYHLLNLMKMNDIENEFDWLCGGGNHLIAKWAFKTAILLLSTQGSKIVVPISHFQELFNGNIPNNVVIEIAFSENSTPSQWFGSDYLSLERTDNSTIEYCTLMQFENLILRVVYSGKADDANDTFEIYPNCGLKGEFRIYEDLDAVLLHCDGQWLIRPDVF